MYLCIRFKSEYKQLKNKNMRQLTIKINIMYYLPYVPEKCRKTRYEKIHEDVPFKVTDVTSEECPTAFVLSDYHHTNDKTEVIRCFKKKLYKRVTVLGRYLHNDEDNEYYPVTTDYLHSCVHPWLTHHMAERDKAFVVKEYREELKRYIVIDGYLWERCGEPRYEIVTFGTGHNHGGTGLFVELHYNPNLPNEWYFNALDWQKAIDKANEVARRRGDTKNVGTFEKMIEVLMPEMVKCNPHKEHGDGFHRTLNTITENSSSAGEAGLLCMAYAMAR